MYPCGNTEIYQLICCAIKELNYSGAILVKGTNGTSFHPRLVIEDC